MSSSVEPVISSEIKYLAWAKIKKYLCFKVTRLYLYLLVKSRIFTGLLEIYNLCILKGEMPFKMHKIIYFFQKKKREKYVCLPYLKLSDPLPETLIILFRLKDTTKSSTKQRIKCFTPGNN